MTNILFLSFYHGTRKLLYFFYNFANEVNIMAAFPQRERDRYRETGGERERERDFHHPAILTFKLNFIDFLNLYFERRCLNIIFSAYLIVISIYAFTIFIVSGWRSLFSAFYYYYFCLSWRSNHYQISMIATWFFLLWISLNFTGFQ